MTLSINIEQMAQPVMNETGRTFLVSKFVHFLLNKLEFLLEKMIKRMCNDIDIFILSLEGSLKHLSDLSPEESKKVLIETKKVIIKLDKMGEKLNKSNFYDNELLKSKYLYMQKSIYKIESKLHKISFKNELISPTENYIKEGVIKMNSLYTQKLLAK